MRGRWRGRGGPSGSGAAPLAAGLVLGALAGAGPLYSSSVATSLVERAVTDFDADVLGVTAVAFARDPSGAGIAAAGAQLAAAVDEIEGLGSVQAQHVLQVRLRREGRGDPEFVNVLASTDAVVELPLAAGARTPGVFAPEQHGFAVGDEIELLGDSDAGPTVTVTGIYPRFDRDRMPEYWQRVQGLFVPGSDLPTADVPPPALVVDPGTFRGLLDAVATPAQLEWWATLDTSALTYERLEELVPAYQSLTTALTDPTAELGRAIAEMEAARGVRVDSSLEGLLARVQASVLALEGPVRAVGMGGQALAVAVIAAAGVAAARRRRSDLRLAVTRGLSPLGLGLRGGIAALLPVLFGAVTGWVAAVALTRWLGPGSRLDVEAAWAALYALAVPLVAGLLLVVIGTTVEAARAGRLEAAEGQGRTRLRVPVDLVAALAAAAIGWQLRGRSPVITAGSGVPELDLLLLAFPLLVLVALSGLAARVFAVAVRGLRRLPLERVPALYLASRRLGGAGSAPLLLVAVGATAVGTMVFARTLVASTNATIAEKAGLLVGADVVVPLPRATLSQERLGLEGIGEAQTTVRRNAARWLPDGASAVGADVDVLVIDPQTFDTVAFAGRKLGQEAMAAAVARLDGTPGRATAVVVGGLAGGRGELAFTETIGVAVEVAARVEAFPGMTGERPLLVIADGAYDQLAVDSSSRSVLTAGAQPELWLRGDPAALTGELEVMADDGATSVAFGVFGQLGDADTVAALAERPGIAAITSTFSLLRVQAGFAALLALVALLLYQQVSARRRRLSEAFAARMGFDRAARLRAAALEPAVLLGAAVVASTGAGMAAARLVLTAYDPVPDLAVPPLLVVPGLLLAVVAAIALAAVAVSAASRGASSGSRVAELLRMSA